MRGRAMKTVIRWCIGTFVVMVVFAICLLTYLLIAQDDLGPVADLFEEPLNRPPADGVVTVQYLGNVNLLFSDGKTAILIDGWFSRPGTFETLLTDIESDELAIDAALKRAGIDTLSAIIPVHSHYDHAMDSPRVAQKTGAVVIGSKSTANIARGQGLDESKIHEITDTGAFKFGDFSLRLIKSKHFSFPNAALGGMDKDEEVIDAPLVPPAGAFDYKMGGAYAIFINHPTSNALVQGSAGFIEDQLALETADVVFLGVAGITGQSQEYQDAYWQHVPAAVGAKKVYPVHYDSFTHPLGDIPELPNLLLDKVLGHNAIAGIQWAREKAGTTVTVGLLPMWDKVRLY